MKKITLIYALIFILTSCGTSGNSNYDSAENEETTAASENIEERKLIVTAHINVKSSDVEKSYKSVEEKLKEYNGYFESVNSSDGGYHITLRIPKNDLYDFISFIESVENIESKNINSKDVTENYYDTENRIKNREALLEKFRSYLDEARNMDEILSVEDRINDLTYEIERMKGTLNDMISSIEYSSVTLNIRNPSDLNRDSSAYEKYLSLISFLKAFFSSIIFFLIGFVAAAIPIILILALFYYICFGKIGLIKKLYKRIK